MLQQRDGLDRAAFHQCAGEAARGWSGSPGVSRLRWTPMEPYDETGWQSPGVRHDWPAEEQYQAIARAGATNQLQPDLLRALYGAVVDGARA